MYRIEAPSTAALKAYSNKYAPILRSSIEYYLNGGVLIREFGRKKILKCKIGIKPNSNSFIARFLNKLSEGNNIEKLLYGDFAILLKVIRILTAKCPDYSQKLTKSRLVSIKYKTTEILEDFHSIVYDIFVEKIYDNPAAFDKTEFIKNRKLKICPYCGISIIESIEAKDNYVIKPHIDHFLPKSIYPFLALSFYNLIPSCPECNMVPNKGDKDPLSIDRKILHLMNPYGFNEGAFIFDYNYNAGGEFDENNFSVFIDYLDNLHLQKGYNDITFIETLYHQRKAELKALWLKIKSLNKSRLKFAEAVLPDATTDELLLPDCVFGYALDEKNSRVYAMFKFNKDLYYKIVKNEVNP